MAPTFVCDPDVDQYEVGQVSEIPGACFYELTVRTRYACDGMWGVMCDASCFPVYTVKVVDAKNLPDEDLIGKSDPYVEVYALYGKEGEQSEKSVKVSTSIKKNKNNPSWNEEFTFDEAKIDDEYTFTAFKFMVWDDDEVWGMGGADFLGETGYVQASEITDCDTVYSIQLDLKRDDDGQQGTIFVQLSTSGCCD